MRVVLDTSVIVASLRSERGASRQLLKAALEKRYVLLVSVPLMMEYQAVATRPEHVEAAGISADQVESILGALASVLEPVHFAYLWRPQLRDPGDEMVLETAVNGRADLLVTLNVRDLVEAGRRFGIPVERPGAAWRIVQRRFHEEE